MTNEEAIRILHCPSMYVTDEDGEMAHTVPMFSKAYGEALAVAFKALEQQPCEDCISRQEARNALLDKGQHSRRYKLGQTWELNLLEIEEVLKELPSVTPARPKGKWREQTDINSKLFRWYKCSGCGAYIGVKTNYCSNCGAEMEV